jgi:lysophospholipase L1-like esterase
MYDKLNIKLLILQYGGNVMPYIKDEKGAVNYGKWFESQLYFLKKQIPNIAIIVIGPSDMSVKEKDKYVTYPHLETVRDALKNATFNAGAVYWDMYEAMGGKNSMPKWVQANPPLAAPDYTHFSPSGTTKIADMFYDAFIKEYDAYKINSTKK